MKKVILAVRWDSAEATEHLYVGEAAVEAANRHATRGLSSVDIPYAQIFTDYGSGFSDRRAAAVWQRDGDSATVIDSIDGFLN